MRVAVVGAGLQAKRRIQPVVESPGDELAVVSSGSGETARALADGFGCEAAVGWEEVVARPDVDAVIICTPPHLHADIALAAVQAGKHVLCEKPLARTLEEGERMLAAAAERGVVLRCGFNHRYHPAVRQVREWVDAGLIGELMFIRCRYGHCGRPGYEADWRSDPRLVGGGHLMEHGIHAIDLIRWFLGEVDEVMALCETHFWPIAPLEDNAFVLFRSGSGQVASLHASLTQWRNLFSFEVFGRDGYASIEGLGGSYGGERAVLGHRDFTAPFAEQVVEFRAADRSWHDEWREFAGAVAAPRGDDCGGRDGLEAMRLVLAAYQAAQDGAPARLTAGRYV